MNPHMHVVFHPEAREDFEAVSRMVAADTGVFKVAIMTHTNHLVVYFRAESADDANPAFRRASAAYDDQPGLQGRSVLEFERTCKADH